MPYQVLARKCRPANFQTLVGQEHVVRTLVHALDNDRLHHAYLFTGIQGVGKTTIARILAKCLNCETGVTSKPCGQCSACQEIDAGKFIDLIEVDAASRTKVEDTRELLDNVFYAPTCGRYKIYLIDEVHMLSGHSFNALLKTLEEPPEHVKFLLATTDPQKLPVTVLSRCLQFHLKKLPTERIASYLENVLQNESIPFEKTAVYQIARAANGSMRDSLSLLDQAIAFSHENINDHDITQMLGTIEYKHIENIFRALIEKNGKKLLEISQQLAEQGTDFTHVLDELLSTLHSITIAQIIPEAIKEHHPNYTSIIEFSQLITKEDIQLFYQITLMGQRDLPIANTPRIGFEMTLLRLLAFQPVTQIAQLNKTIKPQRIRSNNAIPQTQSIDQIEARTPPHETTTKTRKIDIKDWANLLSELQINGMIYALASNCELKTIQNNDITLTLNTKHAALLTEKSLTCLNEALNKHFNTSIKLTINTVTATCNTPAEQSKQQATKKHLNAIKNIENDTNVQEMIEKLGAIIEPSLVKDL